MKFSLLVLFTASTALAKDDDSSVASRRLDFAETMKYDDRTYKGNKCFQPQQVAVRPNPDDVEPPSLSSLSAWTVADYHETNGLSPGKFLTKGYMYDSPMALKGKLFRPGYETTNTRTTFPSAPGTKLSPGVPGAYPYAEGYELWGGDDTLLGKQRYSSMIGHFGHSHIGTVIAKINVLRWDKCRPTPSLDMMLEHLVEGSEQMFNWFAGLVDSDGNDLTGPYYVAPTSSTLASLIVQLMQMLIGGWGTPENSGIIDPAVFMGQIEGLIGAATMAKNPNVPILQAEGVRLQAFFADVLDLTGTQPIPIMAWKQLMSLHQGHSVDNYLRYREVYRTNSTHPDYATLRARSKSEHDMFVRTGPQMAAFFGLFYSVTNFLDKFYYTPNDEDYAIPVAIMNENIDTVQSVLKERWMEHTVMFNDFAKAAALEDDDAMFEIQVNLLDSCVPLATAIGQLFYRFDSLMRGRKLLTFLKTIVMPA